MIKHIIEQIQQNKGGITLNKDGSIFNKNEGYIYSITNNIIEELKEDNIEDILKGIKLLETSLKKDLKIGSWFSDELKKWFVDISVHEDDLKVALEEAKRFNQLAVFDLKELKAIELKK